jgi:DNA polymerase III alpha subunit
MFITIEDETGIANLVIRPKTFEKQRRIILCAGMIAIHGRIQREGEVVDLVARRLTDLSSALAIATLPYLCLIHSAGHNNLNSFHCHRKHTKIARDEESYSSLNLNAVRREARNMKMAEAETVAHRRVPDVRRNFRQPVGVDELLQTG